MSLLWVVIGLALIFDYINGFHDTANAVALDAEESVVKAVGYKVEGGELVIEDSYGTHEVKLEAGDAIVYPSTSLHRVEPVTAGCRWASFMFIQSLVRSDEQRRSLFELDQSIQSLRAQLGDTPAVVQLTGHYHNLLRQWAEV